MRPSRLVIDRPLTNKERANQLQQRRKLKLKNEHLHDNLSVLKLNSTYLETADKYYSDRGFLSFYLLVLSCVFIFSFLILLYKSWDNLFNDLFDLLIVFFLFSLVNVGAWLILRPDSFCYTHYPIRFNRRKKKVYAFTRYQGVIIADWDKLFFTLDHYSPTALPGKAYAIRGHILSKDGNQVINSFELGILGYSEDFMIANWEFIRRYMEDGAESVASVVEYCLPIANKKAHWQYELGYAFAFKVNIEPTWVIYLFSPFTLCIAIGRLFAMWTSKTPIWPDEIEQACLIEPNDKVNLTDAINQPWSWKQGWAKNPWWKRMAEPKEYDPFDQNNYCDKR